MAEVPEADTSAAVPRPKSKTDEHDGASSSWNKVSDAIVPIVGWSALAAGVMYSIKKIMEGGASPPENLGEAKAVLEKFGLFATSLDEDPFLYVLFRDILLNLHAEDKISLNWLGQSFHSADALLKLEFTLRNDMRVAPQICDSERAKQLAAECIYFLEHVEPAPSSRPVLELKKAQKKIQDAVLRHMRAVDCLVLNSPLG
jgi:hypothetical protein